MLVPMNRGNWFKAYIKYRSGRSWLSYSMIIVYFDHAYFSMDWTGASHREAKLLPAHHGHLLSSWTCSSEAIKLSSSYVKAELQITVITILKCTQTVHTSLVWFCMYTFVYTCVWAYLRRPQVNVRHPSICSPLLSFLIFFLGDMPSHWSWSSLTQLDYLAGNLQASACLYLHVAPQDTEIIDVHCFASLLCGC